ncbi:unnamed protein product, partial [Mesorhabditis spiculigera]
MNPAVAQAEAMAKMAKDGGAVHRDRSLYRIAPYAIPIRPQMPQMYQMYPQALLNPAALSAASLQQAAFAQQAGLVDYAALAAAMTQQQTGLGVGQAEAFAAATSTTGLEQYGYPYNMLQSGFPLGQTQLSKEH